MREINTDRLIAELAKRVMGWEVGPERFLTANRSWIPRWRFNPLARIEDAFTLLDTSRSKRYAIVKAKASFNVQVECDGRIGNATGKSPAQTITLALARCLGLDVQSDTRHRSRTK